jgi:hypothetical protein
VGKPVRWKAKIRQEWKGSLLTVDNTKLPKTIHYYKLEGRRNGRPQEMLSDQL